MNGTVLVVEGEPQLRAAVADWLGDNGFQVLSACDRDGGAQALLNHHVDCLLVAAVLPDGSGYDLVELSRHQGQPPVTILMSASEDAQAAVEALRHRVDDYLIKPFEVQDLRDALLRQLDAAPRPQVQSQRVIAASAQAARKVAPGADSTSGSAQEWRDRYAPRILGDARPLLDSLETMRRICDTDCSVLIHGASGTGKELVARALHDASDRAQRAFITVNCAAIPENLIESELFGHARGAFTGATGPRVGRFVAADGGTLFLDEIGELPLALQAKLLRAVQEKEVTPLGESRARKVDVRLISATHRDLDAMVEEGTFREDLLYRIQVIPVELPPLKERREDITLLITQFLQRTNTRRKRNVSGIDPEAMRVLKAYDWPGNVRQLENTIERLVLLRGEGVIGLADLPPRLRGAVAEGEPTELAVLPDEGIDLRDAVEQYENQLIRQALERTGWNKNRAAAVLRMNRTTLVEKLKKKNLSADEQRCA